MPKIAIIGAGFTGAYLAFQLKNYYQVTVFEKARGVGGRMSTRYVEKYEFDHGAAFFEVHDAHFKDFIAPWCEKNILANFPSSSEYVCLPRMNQWIKFLLNGVDVQTGVRIEKLQYHNHLWTLFDEEKKIAQFDYIISTAPAQQTASLLPTEVSFHHELVHLGLQPQMVMMLGTKKPFDELKVMRPAVIEKIVCNHLKPGRQSDAPCYVIYADKQWSQKYLEADSEIIEKILLESLNIDSKQIDYCSLHRWRYAQSQHRLEKPLVLIDSDKHCGACGDWCFNGNVESAFLSSEAFLKEFKL